MKIGVFEFAIDNSADPAVLAKRAEELGFSSFWVPEHAIIPLKTTTPYPGSRDGIIPDAYGRIVDPFVALATTPVSSGLWIALFSSKRKSLAACTGSFRAFGM